jgi:iron complex transport system permease protein
MRRTRGFVRRNLIFILFLIVLPVVFLIAVSIGSVRIPIENTFHILIGKIFGFAAVPSIPDSEYFIISSRVPRVLLAGLVGAALAISGAVTQGVFRNPLAEGSTLGISSGAALGAVLFISAGISIPFFNEIGMALASILFAFLALIFILFITYKIDRNLSVNTIILTGVVFSMFVGSIISFMTSISGDKLRQIIFWTLGSFNGKGYTEVYMLLPVVIIGIIVFLAYARELDIFTFGEEQAGYIGINTKRVKLVVFVTVAALIGVSVSVSGFIAFVGLVIPHIVRRVVGQKYNRLLPGCVLAGAVFLMLTDLISRVVISPSELPIGVVTSFIGSIVFLWIFYTRANQRKKIKSGGMPQ